MAKELSVRLHGEEVGLLRLVNGKMEFSYDNNTKASISLSLPLQKEPFKEKACRAYFGGLLPENPNMREILAKKYNINVNDDFKLLEAIGHDCAGAISFHQLDEPINIKKIYKLKGTLLVDNEFKKFIEELPYRPYMGKRLSLAGAQEKAAICLYEDKFLLPDDNVPTTHILKTALPNYIQSIQNEYICMKSAKEIGLNVANVEIRKIDNLEILLIERFDRLKHECDDILDNDPTPYYERILQEDFAQALGVQSRDKYSITFKDCLKVLNQTQSPALAKSNFVKQVIFNYLIGNADAHGKNFSIYWLFDDIKLTPAYDLLCSSIYDCDQRIAMKIGKARFYADITDKDWELFAQDLDISPKVVFTELEKQKKLLPGILEKLAKELDCEVGYKILDYVKSSSIKTNN